VIRDEAGFSLIELMTAMAIGSVVLTMLMIVTMRALASSADTQNRIETGAAARQTMDTVMQLLDSQTCLLIPDPRPDHDGDVKSTPPVLAASDYSVTFYADLNASANGSSPDKYTLVYDAAAKTLTEQRYDAIGVEPSVKYDDTKPSMKRQLADNIVPARVNGVAQPIFKYYTFPADGTTAPVQIASAALGANLAKITRVEVQFQPVPRKSGKEAVNAANSVFGASNLATADPGTDTVCP
jgi:prepilin-type N-terminal cleavage/methylation domain-containing protein